MGTRSRRCQPVPSPRRRAAVRMVRGGDRSIAPRHGTDARLAGIVHDWWSASLPAPVARDVLLAAIELFAERGYHATTTRDIVTRVGMSTGAMYAYFRSKEELLYEVCL